MAKVPLTFDGQDLEIESFNSANITAVRDHTGSAVVILFGQKENVLTHGIIMLKEDAQVFMSRLNVALQNLP